MKFMRRVEVLSRFYFIYNYEVLFMTGIYYIKNLINNKYYIGKSKDILHRFSQHKYYLNNNNHINKHLQNSWNKYGIESFEFSILEECEEALLNEREKYWIEYFNSFENGYNLDKGGEGVLGFKHTKDQIIKMRKIQNPIPILQFDLNYNFINYFEGGISHAAKELKYTKECILRCCEHLGKQITYKNYYWIYEDEYINENFSWNNYLNQKWSCNIVKKTGYVNTRKICQYDLNRNLIKIWNSYSDIEKAGYTRNQVNTICNHRKNKKTHKGYIWAYDDYDFSDGYFDSIQNHINNASENRKKKILQYNIDGKFIKQFDSMSEAAYETKCNISQISKAIKCHTIAANYFWCYINDNWIDSNLDNLHQIYVKSIKYTQKKIIQFDLNHNPIKIYNSVTEAAKYLNIKSVGNISRAAKNNSICKNYYWKYA